MLDKPPLERLVAAGKTIGSQDEKGDRWQKRKHDADPAQSEREKSANLIKRSGQWILRRVLSGQAADTGSGSLQ
ncbi:MAG: hypothetical protein AMXMBFR74_09240 [Parvibaculum sp.]